MITKQQAKRKSKPLGFRLLNSEIGNDPGVIIPEKEYVEMLFSSP